MKKNEHCFSLGQTFFETEYMNETAKDVFIILSFEWAKTYAVHAEKGVIE